MAMSIVDLKVMRCRAVLMLVVMTLIRVIGHVLLSARRSLR